MNLKHKLDEIVNLTDNWDGYGAVVPSSYTIENVHHLLSQINPNWVKHLDEDSITPSTYGTISLYWELSPNYFLRVEIGDTEWAYFYQIGDKTGESNDNQPYPDTGTLEEIDNLLVKLYETTLHNQALDFADEADLKRRAGFIEEAKILYERAYHLEYQAACLIKNDPDREPSYTILMESAKALAELAGIEAI